MIKAETISHNALKVTLPEKLAAEDFLEIAPQVDGMIERHGKIRLLIDASGFGGWEDITAFERHAGFVKNHQQHVERIAAIVGQKWQHWLVAAARMFVHPQVRAYEKGHDVEASRWLSEDS
jgi:hypothetical protein